MQSDKEFETFSQAYLRIVEDVISYGAWVDGVTDPYSIGSDFGKKIIRTKEILVYTFCVADPRCRELAVSNKSVNRPYLLANFLWSLLGTKEGKWIIPFNNRGQAILNDKEEAHAAIGPHVFQRRNNTFHQLSDIENLLKRDPTTRRAVFQFFSQIDIESNAKDIPCYNHIQFFIREGMLHAHVVMRSQNALMVLPYDFFFFSLFQEALSVRLGVKLGKMFYTANSMHIYEDKVELAKAISPADETQEYMIMEDFSDTTIENLQNLFSEIVAIWGTVTAEMVASIMQNSVIDEYWRKLILSHFQSGNCQRFARDCYT